MAYPNPPGTAVAATALTAAFWNANVRDAFNAIIPTASTTLAFGTYTPTIVQSSTLTKTVTKARYFQVGKIVTVSVILAITSAGVANNKVTVSLPVTAQAGGTQSVGAGFYFNAAGTSSGNNPFVTVLDSTTTMAGIDSTQVGGVFVGQTGSAFAEAAASGDSITIWAVYEAA